MSAVVDKSVHISGSRARQLAQMAAARGLTEDALIEHGLDLLFRERDWLEAGEQAVSEGKVLLLQMEAELGPIPAPTSTRRDTRSATIIVSTPIDPERISGLKERR